MDTAQIAGTIAGKIMSIVQGTSLHKETVMIRGINFDEVADSVRAYKKGGRTIVELEISDTVLHLMFRKHWLMRDKEVWDIDKMQDISRMLRYLQDEVQHHYTLIAAAGIEL